MSVEPLITIEDLAAVLRVTVDMTRAWEARGILPVEEDIDTVNEPNKKYRQRNVVLALREFPEIMDTIKQAMMAKRGIVNEPAEDTGK